MTTFEPQRQHLGAANSCGDLRFDEASGTKEEAKETLASVPRVNLTIGGFQWISMGIPTEEKPWKDERPSKAIVSQELGLKNALQCPKF